MHNVADELEAYFIANGVLLPGTPREEWYADNWVRVPVRGWRIPILPIHGFKDSLIIHDMHHLISGYSISFKDELAIAAWELSSGGCGHFYLYWIDRITFMLLGLILFPLHTCQALKRGAAYRNLFAYDKDRLYEMDMDTLRLLTKRH